MLAGAEVSHAILSNERAAAPDRPQGGKGSETETPGGRGDLVLPTGQHQVDTMPTETTIPTSCHQK